MAHAIVHSDFEIDDIKYHGSALDRYTGEDIGGCEIVGPELIYPGPVSCVTLR